MGCAPGGEAAGGLFVMLFTFLGSFAPPSACLADARTAWLCSKDVWYVRRYTGSLGKIVLPSTLRSSSFGFRVYSLGSGFRV
ncbi:hypothetical protein T484DRAFT_1947668 [Baffinella frigidus]|nr:hypothetical protein T484DRAFT_1947668 [Cryptophyta sp. CCMP2293]